MDQYYAMTVDGPVGERELGTTYVHEHLLVKPQSDDPKYRDYTLDDRDKSAQESRAFFQAGGRTLVEMTPIHYGRDVRGYRAIARAAQIQVICTTGFHKEEFMPPWFGDRSEEDLFELVKREALEGIDGTDIRPGVIKFGTSYGTVTRLEEKAIRVAARAQRELGIPISTHCDKGTMGLEQAEILKSLGVDLSRVLLCHIDSRMDIEYAMKICELGANICLDHVGRELADRDQFRVEMITELVRAGFAGRVTLSGDMGKKGYLPAYGGKPGLAYILTDLRGELMKYISREDFRRLTVENPARIFAVFKNR